MSHLVINEGRRPFKNWVQSLEFIMELMVFLLLSDMAAKSNSSSRDFNLWNGLTPYAILGSRVAANYSF